MQRKSTEILETTLRLLKTQFLAIIDKTQIVNSLLQITQYFFFMEIGDY
jgi:hypothetical protein